MPQVVSLGLRQKSGRLGNSGGAINRKTLTRV